MYTSSDDNNDGYYDNFIDEAEPEPTAEPSYDHQHEIGWGRGRPPKFFSHPNGTAIHVLSRESNQTILEPSPILL